MRFFNSREAADHRTLVPRARGFLGRVGLTVNGDKSNFARDETRGREEKEAGRSRTRDSFLELAIYYNLFMRTARIASARVSFYGDAKPRGRRCGGRPRRGR